jgi:two-component system, OmpR family, sensor histidine kinase VicK
LTIDTHDANSKKNSVEKTEVLYGVDNATNALIRIASDANTTLYACIDSSGPPVDMKEIEPIRNAILDAKNRGVKLRYVTEITKDNIHYWKESMKIIDELRHLEGVKGNFATNGIEHIAIAMLQQDKPVVQVIYSNVKAVVDQHLYIFGTLWDKATSAEQKIREIEEGIEQEYYKVITDHKKVSQILVELAKSVKEEALIVLPNDRSMVRLDRLGVIDYAIKASQVNGTDVKIICPLSEVNSKVVKKISDNAPNIKILNGNNSPYGIYIVDSQRFLRVELRVAEAEIFSEAIGLAFYSNSRGSAESFKLIFELLWNECVLNEELKKTYDRQKGLIKMQKEFIDIAAHELRTPVQPILSLTEVLRSKIKDNEQEKLLAVIIRNAKRLGQLTQNILDVTRIESQSLQLKKEIFDVNDIILNIVQDYRHQLEKEDNADDVKLLLLYDNDGSNKDNNVVDGRPSPVFIQADKERISQVISNLLNNAIKFSKKTAEDSISIAITCDKENNQVIVSVKDTATGIDPEILPRLFSKFATKSDIGTGLGLFISKSIIEAHGGRIWAQNNPDGRGATFAFSLQLISSP